MTRTTRRPGTTLMEVLIATGILAIGMLAILALFPIGAVNMARAINQNRAADHGTNSDAMFRYYWKRAWVDSNGGGLRPLEGYLVPQPAPQQPIRVPGASDIEPLMYWLDSVPDAGGNPVRMISLSASQPSFAVLVDPVGFLTQPTPAERNFVAGNNVFPRRTTLRDSEPIPPIPPNPLYTPMRTRATVRLTTLLDEMSYDGNGEPSALTGQLDRGGRYNVAWLIRRPKNHVPHEVHVQVLVYAGRSPTDTASAELVFPAVAQDYFRDVEPKPKSLTISLNGQPRPPVMSGKWIAFTTPIQPQQAPPPNTQIPPTQWSPMFGIRYQAFDFYRIAAVQDVNDDTLTLELEQPLRTYDVNTLPGYTLGNPPTGTLLGQVVVFDNLFEVFDRGVVSANAITGR